jgi:hypothetical protein
MMSAGFGQLKKIIALLVLKGISVLGLLLGLTCLLGPIMLACFIPRDDLDPALLCIMLITSVTMLVIGAWLMYDCYRMLRGKSFGVISSIPAVLAYMVFGSVVEPVHRFAITWVSGIRARTRVDLASGLVALVCAVLVYVVCTKLLKRLLEAAYSPEELKNRQSNKRSAGQATNIADPAFRERSK